MELKKNYLIYSNFIHVLNTQHPCLNYGKIMKKIKIADLKKKITKRILKKKLFKTKKHSTLMLLYENFSILKSKARDS